PQDPQKYCQIDGREEEQRPGRPMLVCLSTGQRQRRDDEGGEEHRDGAPPAHASDLPTTRSNMRAARSRASSARAGRAAAACRLSVSRISASCALACWRAVDKTPAAAACAAARVAV